MRYNFDSLSQKYCNRKEFQYCHNVIVLCHIDLYHFSSTGVDRLTDRTHHDIKKRISTREVLPWAAAIHQAANMSQTEAQNMLFLVQESRQTQAEGRTNKHFHNKLNKMVTIAGISRQSLLYGVPVKWVLSLLTTNKGTCPSCFPFCLISCTRSFT